MRLQKSLRVDLQHVMYSSRHCGALLKVAREHDPARQCKDAHQGTGNETRARDLRSGIEALPKDDSKEAAGNGTDQNHVASLFERQADHTRRSETQGRL